MMGYIKHEAVIVTSWNTDAIELAACRARNLGLTVIGPSAELVNGYRTMTVCPDGGKEGWGESCEAAEMRREFCEWMDSIRYADGSTLLEWCQVSYGSDDRTAVVTDHAWMEGEK